MRRLRGESNGIRGWLQPMTPADPPVAEEVSFGRAAVRPEGRGRKTVRHVWGVVREVELDHLADRPALELGVGLTSIEIKQESA